MPRWIVVVGVVMLCIMAVSVLTAILTIPLWIGSDNAIAVFIREAHTKIFQAVLAVLKGGAR